MRESATFTHRGIDIPYSELPNAETNLLFGNVLWPCAEALARIIIDAQQGLAKVWTPSAAKQLGVPLEVILARRFGLTKVAPAPVPDAFERLGLEAIVPKFGNECSVLEIGAGVGLAGLACHACGATTLITDGESRLIKNLQAKHAGNHDLRFEVLDWRTDFLPFDASCDHGVETFDVILGCEVLHPVCRGEVHVPQLIARRLKKTAGARAILVTEVRSATTCETAVRELCAHGLVVATFQICNGREAFETPSECVPQPGACWLLLASWPPASR